MRFECMPPAVEEYLALTLKKDGSSSREEMMEAPGGE